MITTIMMKQLMVKKEQETSSMISINTWIHSNKRMPKLTLLSTRWRPIMRWHSMALDGTPTCMECVWDHMNRGCVKFHSHSRHLPMCSRPNLFQWKPLQTLWLCHNLEWIGIKQNFTCPLSMWSCTHATHLSNWHRSLHISLHEGAQSKGSL